MTVTTTVLPASWPALGQVEGEQGQQDVAVHHGAGVVDGDDPVGVAVEGQPEVGPAGSATVRASSPGSVEPHLSLMLVPSGASCSAVTVPPAAASTPGANALAAPLAQSTTMCSPARVRPSVAATQLVAVEVGRARDRR